MGVRSQNALYVLLTPGEFWENPFQAFEQGGDTSNLLPGKRRSIAGAFNNGGSYENQQRHFCTPGIAPGNYTD